MPHQNNGQTGLAGEHYVLAQLLTRGWAAARTEGNSPYIDILAAKADHTIQVQVKAVNGNDVPLKQSKILHYIHYIVVSLDPANQATPRYFIIPGTRFVTLCDDLYYRSPCGIEGRIRTRALPQFENRWDLLE